MPEGWAGLIARRGVAIGVVATAVLVTAVLGRSAADLGHDDDVLAFLPREDPDVRAFHEINARFGGLEVALVGVGTKDVFDPAFFAKLQKTTRQLIESQEVEHALSLANVEDFKPSADGGIETGLLVPGIPEDPAQRAALRSRALNMEMVAGQLVDADGQAAAIVAFASHGTEAKAFAAKVKQIALANLSGEELHFGGAPFVSTYIYGATQDDLRRLTPWAVAVIVLIVMAAFRDVAGAAVALLNTGMGIVITVGVMSLVGARFNIVLSSMPVILFAVGSAYAIRILGGYRARAASGSPREVVVSETVAEVAPMVLASALTTSAGLLSFLVMDIGPLRTFGVYTALGVVVTVTLAITFVPALLVLLPVKAAKEGRTGFADAWSRFASGTARRRAVIGAALAASAISAAPLLFKVDSTMDETAFFKPGSPPDRARTFLGDHFGFSQFLQIELAGDFGDPFALRALELLADRIYLVDGVTSVQHVGQVIARTNESMEGARRVPDDAAKATLLYGLVSGQPALKQLVTPDRSHALLHVKLRAADARQLERVLASVEEMVRAGLATSWRVAPIAEPEALGAAVSAIAERARAVGKLYGASPAPAEKLEEAVRAARGVEAPREAVEAAVLAFLGSAESPVPIGDRAPDLAAKVAALGPSPDPDAVLAKVKEALGGADTAEDLALALGTPLEEAWRASRAKARAEAVAAASGMRAPAEPEKAAAFSGSLAHALSYLDAPMVGVPERDASKRALTARVSGLPVLHRGLSRSVEKNQLKSLLVALLLVIPILALTFRSLSAGLLAAAPTLLTLMWIYAGMALLGIHLDVGTSMLGSLIIGAGVDYAMHYLAAWRGATREAAAGAGAAATAPAAWTNALMVAAGFFVLTLGEARPLRSFGGLTACAMVAAALATYLAIPVLARRLGYGRRREWSAAVTEEESPLAEDRT